MFPDITRDDIFRLETEGCGSAGRARPTQRLSSGLQGDPEVAKQTANIPYPYEPRHLRKLFIVRRVRGKTPAALGLSLVMAPKRRPDEAIGIIGAQGAESRGVATLGFWLGAALLGAGLHGRSRSGFRRSYIWRHSPWAKSPPPHCRPIPLPWSFRRSWALLQRDGGD